MYVEEFFIWDSFSFWCFSIDIIFKKNKHISINTLPFYTVCANLDHLFVIKIVFFVHTYVSNLKRNI